MSRQITKDIEISWGDMDAFGHVNNAAYLRYLEDARIDWLNSLDKSWESDDKGPAVVNININFRREIRFPTTIRVKLTISQASEKRVLNHYVIVDRNNPETVFADAELTLVWIDRKTRRSIPVPAMIRQSIDQGLPTPGGRGT